jgi:hypothetical protein
MQQADENKKQILISSDNHFSNSIPLCELNPALGYFISSPSYELASQLKLFEVLLEAVLPTRNP